MSPRELERRTKHKLAVLRHVEEVIGNVSATCRYYGISRHCSYKWRRRLDDEGFDGLGDRSSVPHCQPAKTAPQIVEKVLWPRQQYTSDRRRSRCTCTATTTSRSARPVKSPEVV